MAAIQVGFASNTRTLQEIVSHVSQMKGESGQLYVQVIRVEGEKIEPQFNHVLTGFLIHFSARVVAGS